MHTQKNEASCIQTRFFLKKKKTVLTQQTLQQQTDLVGCCYPLEMNPPTTSAEHAGPPLQQGHRDRKSTKGSGTTARQATHAEAEH